MKISSLPFQMKVQLCAAGFKVTDSIDSFNDKHFSPLRVFVRLNQVESVRYLLDKGVDPNLASPGETTPILFEAIENNSLECFRLLLEAGTSPFTPANRNNPFFAEPLTPLQQAAIYDNKIMIEALLRKHRKHDLKYLLAIPLQHVIAKATLKDIPIIKLFIEYGADISGCRDSSVEPPLITAIRSASKKDRLAILEFILSQGADPNKEALDKGTALMVAAEAGLLDCMKLLVKHGADIHHQLKIPIVKYGNACFSPLHFALEGWPSSNEKNFQCLKYLLESGVDPNLGRGLDEFGGEYPGIYPPFLSSIRKNKHKEFCLLLRHNSHIILKYPQRRDCYASMIPLSEAIYFEDLPKVNILLTELLALATLKMAEFQKQSARTAPKLLRTFVEENITLLGTMIRNIDVSIYYYMIRISIETPALNFYMPKQLFLTAYSLIRVAKFILPKKNLSKDIISNILSYCTEIIGMDRQRDFMRYIYPQCIYAAEHVSAKVTQKNIQILKGNKAYGEALGNDPKALKMKLRPASQLTDSQLIKSGGTLIFRAPAKGKGEGKLVDQIKGAESDKREKGEKNEKKEKGIKSDTISMREKDGQPLKKKRRR